MEQTEAKEKAEAINKQREQFVNSYNKAQDSNAQELAQNTVTSAAQSMQNMMLSAMDTFAQPIYAALSSLQTIADMLNDSVDINGNRAKLDKTITKFKTNYEASDLKYVEDMLSKHLSNPYTEDSPVLQEVAGELMNSTVGCAFKSMQPLVEFIESIIPDFPVCNQIKAVIQAVNGIVEFATTYIPDEQLDKMLSMKMAQDSVLIDKLKKLSDKDALSAGYKGIYEDAKDEAEKTYDKIKKSSSEIKQGIGDGIKQSWKNFKCPKIPPEVEASITNLQSALENVCRNISNIQVVLIFKILALIVKIINAILKALKLNEIIKKILPPPLNDLEKIFDVIVELNQLVIGFPVSFTVLLRAIVKNKIKQLAVMTNKPSMVESFKPSDKLAIVGQGACGGGKNNLSTDLSTGLDLSKFIDDATSNIANGINMNANQYQQYLKLT